MTPTAPDPESFWRAPLLVTARVTSRVRADLPLVVLDAVVVAAAYTAVLLLRLDGDVTSPYWARLAGFLVVAEAVHLGANALGRLYGHIWRHAGVAEARRLAVSVLAAAAWLTVITLVTHRMPLSVVLLGAAVTGVLSGAIRFQSRLLAFNRAERVRLGVRVAVVGAGRSGAAIVSAMQRDPQTGLIPVVVIDDDPRKHGRLLAGVPIVGGTALLTDVITEYSVTQVVLAISDAGADLVRQVATAAEQHGVTVKVLPGTRALVDGPVSLRDARDLKIEDLLGRDEVVTDLEAVGRLLAGRVVLITGAGGSIGSEIARQVQNFAPAELLLLDHDETHLHDVAGRLGGEVVQVLADIRDRSVIDGVFQRFRPDVVFHAAAHKHVPLLETWPTEALATNVLGTHNVVDAAVRAGTGRLVFISTDKAVEPSSVMGATKWVGEQIVVAATDAERRFCAVRFGNVLGSRGSVIPTFARQIEEGGPVTVTDPKMTRYFMSVSEAVQLVLQAAAFSAGGEIFILEMGRPVNILSLAERMVRLSGRNVGTEIPIRIVGPRPGEKVEEVLHAATETLEPTPHPGIMQLRPPRLDRHRLDGVLADVAAIVPRHDEDLSRTTLFDIVREASQPRPAPMISTTTSGVGHGTH